MIPKASERSTEETTKKVKGSFEKNYQSWYTQACAVVKQLLPDRLPEFVQLYHGDGKRKVIDISTYNIQDWLNGVRAAETILAEKFSMISRGCSCDFSLK